MVHFTFLFWKIFEKKNEGLLFDVKKPHTREEEIKKTAEQKSSCLRQSNDLYCLGPLAGDSEGFR